MEGHNTYSVQINFDVWGNEEDGWEVNYSYYSSRLLSTPLSPTDDELWERLTEAGFISGPLEAFEITDWGDLIEVNRASDGYPLLTLYSEDI